MLDTQLSARFAQNVVDGLGTIVTRTYEGTIPGPTLRVRPGDTLRLTHFNDLPPNPDQADWGHAHNTSHDHGSHDHNTPHHFNTFNLHTHGLHVSPEGIADNVMREFTPFDPMNGLVTSRYVSEIQIPDNHEAGTFWYHPHYHGATTMQLVSGMSGALIVEGPIDEVPEIAQARDVVININELKLRDGQVPDLRKENDLLSVPSTFLVNGAVRPTLRIRSGEVQRWRLINAGSSTVQRVELQGHRLHQIARDGITFDEIVEQDIVALPMGGRADVLVQGGKPGRYEVKAGAETLMILHVGEPSRRMKLPATLPGAPSLPFIKRSELTPTGPNGDGRRTLIFQTEDHAGHGAFTTAFRILGDGATPASVSETDPMDPTYGRFDPGYVNQTLKLGAVEEWTLRNPSLTESNHSFHLHTNPFLVVSLDGTPLSTPVWHDTIGIGQSGEVVIRLRFKRFTGRAVLHCHNLQHEDEGMMQLVEYVR